MDQLTNFIDGQWVGSITAVPNISPADFSDCIGEYASATESDVNDAIEGARRAFPAWRDQNPEARADFLDRAGLSILEKAGQIGHLLSREEGKTLREATGEAMRAGRIFRFFAHEALRVTGDVVASLRANASVEITREPVGVVGIVTPWNFPIAIPAWKIAPALAYGNTVIFKPAAITPGCAHVLAQILSECGTPPGVFNLVSGPGSVVGKAISEHPAVDAITFTGSTQTGRRIAKACILNLKKLQMEMGGKNPMIILADADIDRAVKLCIDGAFLSTGQRCTASSRLIVEASVYDQFVDKMIQSMRQLSVGHPLHDATDIGPVASAEQFEINRHYLRLAASENIEVVGGEIVKTNKQGYYQAPALLLGATNRHRTSREEIFGPIASVIKVADFDEAVDVANDTEFGLSSGICTSSLSHAREFRQRSSAGMVMVNLPTAGVDYHVPFGGRKASSYGPREQGRHAITFFTTTKTSYFAA